MALRRVSRERLWRDFRPSHPIRSLTPCWMHASSSSSRRRIHNTPRLEPLHNRLQFPAADFAEVLELLGAGYGAAANLLGCQIRLRIGRNNGVQYCLGRTENLL